eukprot:6915881-Prorocentrum_lima.AAC.1
MTSSLVGSEMCIRDRVVLLLFERDGGAKVAMSPMSCADLSAEEMLRNFVSHVQRRLASVIFD